MISNREPDLTRKVKETIDKELGLSVKELAERLKTNRQFMTGFLAALEEKDEITSRTVGPARIYFKSNINRWGAVK